MIFYIIKIIPIKIISNTAFVLILITLFSNFYQNQKNYNKIQLSPDSISKRTEFKKITNLIHENKFIDIKKSNLLTFDEKFFVWAILNDIKYLKIINGTLVPKKNFMIENDLINTFKYLGLTKGDFFDFIKNNLK